MKMMGGSIRVSRLFLAILCGACAIFLTGTGRNPNAAEVWRARVSAKLQSVYDARLAGTVALAGSANTARFDEQGRVEADVNYNCSSGAPTAAFAAAGLSVTVSTVLPPVCVAEGWIAPAALPGLAAVAAVTRVTVPSYARHMPHPSQKSTAAAPITGGIDGNAITIMHADQFVAQAGGGGGGVVVGVQSQGIASLSTIQGRHELPTVSVLTAAAGGSNTPSADEGTALLEEVHAVAPNASLAFCEPQTFVQYIACLQQFANAGSTVMVDDFMFIEQDPMSSSGTDVQSLTQFLAQHPNVALFTSTGNATGSYWEGSYTPVSIASQSPASLNCHNSSQVDTYVNQFAGGANEILTITPTTGISIPMTFAWADPSGQNVSNFDLFWTNTTDPTKSGCLTVSGNTDTVITQAIVVYPGNNIVSIATPDASLTGKFLKLWIGGDGLTSLSIATPGGLVSPQTFAPGVITVGAVNGSDGIANNIEPFSGIGPITVVYPTPAKLQAPVLVAPDGIKVDASGTYFASTLFPDGNFYGTSASAPNAAAVAALIRDAFPNLTLAQLVAALQTGAAQLGASVPDDTFGYGRVDAMGALNTLAAPTMTLTNPADVAIDASATTTSAAQTFTASGTGALHFSVASTNSALVPAAVGSPGITVSPANCGAATLTCSLTVTAAQYQGGTATVTVTAVDGAGRAAPVTMHVTVTNPQTAPPPPPSTTTTTAGGGGGGGGTISLWEILAAALLVLSRTVGAAARSGRAISH